MQENRLQTDIKTEFRGDFILLVLLPMNEIEKPVITFKDIASVNVAW